MILSMWTRLTGNPPVFQNCVTMHAIFLAKKGWHIDCHRTATEQVLDCKSLISHDRVSFFTDIFQSNFSLQICLSLAAPPYTGDT